MNIELLLEHPYDVALAAPQMEETESPGLQADVLEAAITATAFDRQRLEDAHFFAQSCISSPLSLMETIYQMQDRRAAINILAKRHTVNWTDSEYHISNRDPRLVWNTNSHYIDMLVCVSRDIGLSLLIPNERNHAFTFQFDFSKPYRQFSPKFAKLGFDAKSSFLWIGKSTSHEDVFVAWAPIASLTSEGDQVDVGLCTGKTQLSDEHYRLTVMFFAFVMEKLGRRGIWVKDRYPSLKERDEFEAASNILHHHVLLSEAHLRELDQLVQSNYEDWINQAPVTYTEDTFVQDRKPIIVTSQYGQDQVMVESPDDAESWRRHRDFSKVHYMSVAIASHFRARLATEGWEPRDEHDLWEDHPDGLFTSPDQTYRRQLSFQELQELDLEDEEGSEIRIYTHHGHRVKRRLGRFPRNCRPLGALVNIASINELFGSNHAGDQTHYLHGLPGPLNPSVTVYPQAGLRSAGHFQASGLMSGFYPRIEAMNQVLREGPDARFPIQGVACQGYNSAMHSIRGNGVQHHEAQQGLVTAALGGRFACDLQGKESCKKYVKMCNNMLPHRLFDLKISNAALKRDLRLENVYVIDLTALREEDQSGDIIFDEILCPLTRIWKQSSILDSVIEHTVLLSPEAYPAVYSWMSYPLTALIEINWEMLKSLNKEEEEERLRKEVRLTEITACAERALNFMHTGNPAVIKTSIMNPLWIGRAIVNDGVPSFNPNIVRLSHNSIVKVIFSGWPYDNTRNLPKSTTESAIRYRYNEMAVGNYMATFSLNVHMERPIPTFLSSIGPHMQRAKSCVYTTLVALIADSQRLVSLEVTKACNRDLQSQDQQLQASARKRLDLLAKWQKLKHPFAWNQPGEEGSATYSLLLTLLNSYTDGRLDPLPTSSTGESMTYSGLAQHLLKLGCRTGDQPHTEAPLIKNGICSMSLRMTAPVTLRLMNDDSDCTHALWAAGIEALNINFLPWRPHNSKARTTTLRCWMQFQRSPGASKLLERGSARDIAIKAAKQDPSAPWKVPSLMSDMKGMWEKNVLPSEWDIKNASLSTKQEARYVSEAYAWVRDNFDGQKTYHRLGIVISIMFSRMLPNIAHPKAGESIDKSLSADEVTIAIREMAWDPALHKGCTQVEPFITMMSTAIISILDSDSPFRRHLKGSDGIMGNGWTEKHGAKYITPINFIRVGIAKALAHSVTSRPKFTANWDVEGPEALEDLWNDIKDCLASERFGEFYAFRRVLGEKAARFAGGRGHFDIPPTPTGNEIGQSVDR